MKQCTSARQTHDASFGVRERERVGERGRAWQLGDGLPVLASLCKMGNHSQLMPDREIFLFRWDSGQANRLPIKFDYFVLPYCCRWCWCWCCCCPYSRVYTTNKYMLWLSRRRRRKRQLPASTTGEMPRMDRRWNCEIREKQVLLER